MVLTWWQLLHQIYVGCKWKDSRQFYIQILLPSFVTKIKLKGGVNPATFSEPEPVAHINLRDVHVLRVAAQRKER